MQRTTVSMRVGSCHDTVVPSPMPVASSPAATRSASALKPAKVTVRPPSSSSMGASGVVATRRSSRPHMVLASIMAAM